MSEIPITSVREQAEAQWLRLVEKALGGASRDALRAVLDSGGLAEPLYGPREGSGPAQAAGYPGAAPFVRAAVPGAHGWAVVQPMDQADAAAANAQAREDLAQGAAGLWLRLPARGGTGLGARDLAGFETALGGVAPERTRLFLDGGGHALPFAALLLGHARKQGVAGERLSGSLGLDPLAQMAAAGEVPVRRARALSDAVDAALFARNAAPAMTPFRASGRVWHGAGGSAVEELACVLAAAVAYWRALAQADVALDEAAGMIGWHLSADADVFASIAKFRAARALWARATQAAGVGPQPARISAEMSLRTMTARDPHTNLLRGTAAAFAAAAGGAEAIVLAPFSVAAGVPDAFARRLARNTQVILAEESGLGRVADAPGGSWYVETLSHDLAAQAWAFFQQIEAAGGLLAALESGLVARRLAAMRARRDTEIACRQRAITGVSTYPMLDEATPAAPGDTQPFEEPEPGALPDLPPAGRGERMAAMVAAVERGATVCALSAALREPLALIAPVPDPMRRDAHGFEALRAASDAALAVAGVRPAVFLANVGPLAAHGERATWARNIFEAGGIAAIMGAEADSAAALVQAFRDSGATIACLCGRDVGVAALAGAAVALEDAGADAIYLVGTNATLDLLGAADLRTIGRVLHEGCDVLGILREAHRILKVGEVIAAAHQRDREEALTGWAQTERT